MPLSFDPAKRDRTLAERGLDFADAEAVFAGPLLENIDDRFDYGEERRITIGFLGDRLVVIVWTWRDDNRHIISMRKANDREERRFHQQLD